MTDDWLYLMLIADDGWKAAGVPWLIMAVSR